MIAEKLQGITSSVSAFMKRKEDPRFIQGKGRYIDDVKLPNMVQKLAYHQSPSITSRYDHRTEGAKQRAAATSVEVWYCLAHCLAPVVRR